jgi:hypothetical protein
MWISVVAAVGPLRVQGLVRIEDGAGGRVDYA